MFVFVINGICLLLCFVSIWEINVLVCVEFVNIIVLMCLFGRRVLFIFLLGDIISFSVFFGRFIECIIFIVCCVIMLVCLVGLVIIVLFVISVVVIWFKKMVSGKFYGLI